MWKGLKSLKIFLNEKDKIYLWKLFDQDSNGRIQIEEFKNYL